MLIETPAGSGECAYCEVNVSDLRKIESTTLKYIGKYCSGCAKRAKKVLREKVKEQKEESICVAIILNMILKLIRFDVCDK